LLPSLLISFVQAMNVNKIRVKRRDLNRNFIVKV
jgi:hypothetical protein